LVLAVLPSLLALLAVVLLHLAQHLVFCLKCDALALALLTFLHHLAAAASARWWWGESRWRGKRRVVAAARGRVRV
jgi:hypothetical protein